MSEAVRYLELALRDARIVELRHCADERWRSYLFDDLDALRGRVRELYGGGNLYITLNRPIPREVPNGPARPLKDEDIERVVRIPVDFDPARPAECMATQNELARAVAARDRFVAAMRACGWPMPLTAMSGSGAHAIYRCSIPASSELREILATVYNAWRQDFSTEEVGFDIKVRNPSRIFRLYGSWNRKGQSTAERPWRRASCTFPAGVWQAVQMRQLEALASRYAARAKPSASTTATRGAIAGAGDYRSLDVVALAQAHGLYKRPLGSGKHAVRCPWQSEHSNEDHILRTDSVIWEAQPGEWPRYYCSHAHCEGRGMRQLIEFLGDADQFCATEFAPGPPA